MISTKPPVIAAATFSTALWENLCALSPKIYLPHCTQEIRAYTSKENAFSRRHASERLIKESCIYLDMSLLCDWLTGACDTEKHLYIYIGDSLTDVSSFARVFVSFREFVFSLHSWVWVVDFFFCLFWKLRGWFRMLWLIILSGLAGKHFPVGIRMFSCSILKNLFQLAPKFLIN